MPGVPIFNVHVVNDAQLIRKFMLLDRKVQRQIINKVGLPILQAMRTTARLNMRATFARFRRSGHKVGWHMEKGLAIRRSTRRKQLKIYLAVSYRKHPTNVLTHLIEWGFKHVGGKQMPAYLMMTNAYKAHEASAIPILAREFSRMVREAFGFFGIGGKGP